MKKSNKIISLHEPVFKGNEWKYLKECIDTGWVSSVGKFVDLFEKKLHEYTGAKYVVACCNGTSALHIALLLCGIKPNDEVIVPSLSFIATANVITYCGAYPVFIDSEMTHFNIDVNKLENFLKQECRITKNGLINKKTKRIVKAILPVHILGYPAEIKKIVKLSKKYKLKVIEDSAEAIGTFLDGKHAGTFGDIGCLSFNGNKIITTGGGGAILTNNKKYYEKAKYLTQQAKDNHKYDYIHNDIGFNYRLTNIQAALGTAQLEQLNKYINIKEKISKWYLKYFSNIDNIYFPISEKKVRWNKWMFSIILTNFSLKKRNELLSHLFKKNILSRPFWKPIHLQKKFRNFQTYKLENTIKIFEKGLQLPSSINLTENNIKQICSVILKY